MTHLQADGDVLSVFERYRPAIIGELRSVLTERAVPPFSLMRYHLGWEDEQGRPIEGRGGKLLRPALCLLCCEAVGGDWQRALPAAAALELLHNFTLIHDDVEDASPQRHGRETLWRLRGEAQAINAGDGMFALAHVALLRLGEQGHAPERVLRAVQMLDQAALSLCVGQHLDLSYAEQADITCDDSLAMIEGKAAALLAASCGMGALLGGAGADVVDALSEFGRRLGLAFQIRDDLLGIWGDPNVTGKPIGEDLRAGKKSYPVVVGLERATADQRPALQAVLAGDPADDDVRRACALLEELGARDEAERAAQEHAEAAIAALRGIDLVAERRGELEQLARFAAERRS
jgi:geranylgeranyl diphosphate synthase type I